MVERGLVLVKPTRLFGLTVSVNRPRIVGEQKNDIRPLGGAGTLFLVVDCSKSMPQGLWG